MHVRRGHQGCTRRPATGLLRRGDLRGHDRHQREYRIDDRFQDAWRRLNLEHGIKSIQSRPVFSASGMSLGTFVLGFKEERASGAFDEQVATTGADLAGIALNRYRDEQQHALLLGEMQHRARNVFAMVGAIVYSTLRTNPDPI